MANDYKVKLLVNFFGHLKIVREIVLQAILLEKSSKQSLINVIEWQTIARLQILLTCHLKPFRTKF